ncbi:MAG TPA: 3'-5' exonuclease [Geobacteraceae bacterium]|nr:3'-5' exonuclease [Geobacteraceae bacterium]
MKKREKRDYRLEPLNPLEAEIAVTALHSTGEFMVLRRLNLERDNRFTGKPIKGGSIGLCLDTETTGLDHGRDRIIELGIVAFEYDPQSGDISRIIDRYNGFEDPGEPLSREVKEITGINDEMLAGRKLDDEKVLELAGRAALVIAHNAAFDRKFVEDRFPAFAGIPWGCSVSQIDWQAERISSRSLEYLLYKCGGYCINAHRALDDAEGLLGLLLCRTPVSDRPVFGELLKNAQAVTSRICAVNAPFDRKDLLKQRGYRWNDGGRGGCKGWWVNVPSELEPEELAYLARDIYPSGNTSAVDVERIDPLARFSVREG